VEKDLRMYILVNANMAIGAGKLAAQVGHAVQLYVHEVYNGGVYSQLYNEYMEGSIKKIILFAPLNYLELLEAKGYITIRDAGFTELEPNTLTCVNFGIHDYNAEDASDDFKYVRHLKLVK
jgi:PTH2 family peptidyl-tRNA hydrolase